MIWRRGTKSTGTRKRIEKLCRRATGAALPTAGPGSGASRSSCGRGLARSRHDASGDDCFPDARMSNGPGRHAARGTDLACPRADRRSRDARRGDLEGHAGSPGSFAHHPQRLLRPSARRPPDGPCRGYRGSDAGFSGTHGPASRSQAPCAFRRRRESWTVSPIVAAGCWRPAGLAALRPSPRRSGSPYSPGSARSTAPSRWAVPSWGRSPALKHAVGARATWGGAESHRRNTPASG